MRQTYSRNDIEAGSINNQNNLTGTSVSDLDTGASFFLLAVVGTSVTIKDGNDNTIMVVSDQTFNYPVRMENGIKASSSSSSTIVYFKMKNLGV